MITVELIAAFEKIVIIDTAHIVPCHVDAVPLAVVHLDIIPHVGFVAASGVACSADERARYAKFVAQHFERL